MTIDEKIEELKRAVDVYHHMADRCVESHLVLPDLQTVNNGVAYENYANALTEEIEMLEELKSRRTMMLPGGSLEKEIRRKTVTEFVEKLHEELSAKSERLHFDGHTVDMLTLDNALDAVYVAANCMVEAE